MATNLTDLNFEQEVLQSKGVILVDFYADWCGPCKMLAPTLEKLGAEFEGKAKIVKLNVDENPVISQKFSIQALPTLLIFKDGAPVEQMMGFKSEEVLREKLNSHLATK